MNSVDVKQPLKKKKTKSETRMTDSVIDKLEVLEEPYIAHP